MRSAEKISNTLEVPGSFQLEHHLPSRQYSRHCNAIVFSANNHVSQPGSSLKLFGDSRKQNTKWVMRPWKHLMKGDSQERKPNNVLAYFICYASTESSELVQPSASTPLLHQQEAAVAGKQGQQLLEETYLNAPEPLLASLLLTCISPCQ